MRSLQAFAASTILALALTACGDSGDSDDEGSSSGDDSTTSQSGGECEASDITVDGGFGEKPDVTLPDDCDPPSELIIEDLSEGEGPEVVEGSTMLTDYLLVTWSNEAVLDNSFDRGQPFPLENVGQAPVIDGWNEGLVGMKEGGRRLLIVSPDLGYGQGGNGVAPNETLVFVVDAVGVE